MFVFASGSKTSNSGQTFSVRNNVLALQWSVLLMCCGGRLQTGSAIPFTEIQF